MGVAGNRSCARCDGTGIVCVYCKGIGFVYRQAGDGRTVASECQCGKAIVRRASALRPVLEQYSSLSGDLLQKSFEGFRKRDGFPDLREALECAQSYAKKPKGWLVLIGKPGVGKTHLAAAIANTLRARHQLVLFLNVPELLAFLRAGFHSHGTQIPDFDARLKTIKDCPVLILDDFGAHSDTPWADEQLYIILNHRTEQRLPTVITMNDKVFEAKDRLEPRMRSRLVNRDLAKWLVIEAPDHRAEG